MDQKIVVLGTGGTIAGSSAQPDDNVGYRAGARSVQSLLDVLGAERMTGLELHSEQIAQIDSKDASFDFWVALHSSCSTHLQDASVSGIVITHGTDTAEETAWFLANTLPATKPVVLTCAMRPASALSPDGPQNLLDAISLARDSRAFGVSLVCAGTVHAPAHVRKVHPYRLDPFSSGDHSPMGWVEEGQFRSARDWPIKAPKLTLPPLVATSALVEWPWVEIVHSHAGVSAAGVAALLGAGVQGLVVAATGNGTVHCELEGVLRKAMRAGVAVRVVSKCPLGAIVGHPAHGLPLALPGLSAEKARVSLILELMRQP